MKLSSEKCADIIYRIAKMTPNSIGAVALSDTDKEHIYGDYMTLVFLGIWAAQAIEDSKDTNEAAKRVMGIVIDYMEHDVSTEVTEAFDEAVRNMSEEDLEILSLVLGGDMKDYVKNMDKMRDSVIARFKRELLPGLLEDIFEG